jgi:hypothetical protein
MLPSCWSRRWGESSTSAHWRREAKVPAFNSLRRPTAFPWQRWGRWGTCVNMWHPEAKTWSKKQFLQNGWSATWSGLKRLEAAWSIWHHLERWKLNDSIWLSPFFYLHLAEGSSQCPFRDQAAAAPLRCFFSATSANRRCSPCLSQSVSVTSLDSIRKT